MAASRRLQRLSHKLRSLQVNIFPNRDRFFFVHVMKTGGTSLTAHFDDNFIPKQRYPDAYMASNDDFFRRMEAYLHVPRFVEDINAMDGKLRLVSGHVPYAVRSLLNHQYIAITLLRDPIERTLSYLKHCRKYHPEQNDMALEEIYEDPWFYSSFIGNYQTKLFSMTAPEALAENRFFDGSPTIPPRSELGSGENLSPQLVQFRDRSPGRFSLEIFAASTGVIIADDSRLKIAKENLVAMEVVGITECHDVFLKKLSDQYNWRIKSMPRRHVGACGAISPEFRMRIASDNAYDIELYELAKTIAL